MSIIWNYNSIWYFFNDLSKMNINSILYDNFLFNFQIYKSVKYFKIVKVTEGILPLKFIKLGNFICF